MQVTASSLGPLIDITPLVDPVSGDAALQRGNLTVYHALDLDQSPGTTVGGAPALAYNSERVAPEPIIQVQLPTDATTALSASLTEQLTFNGVTQPAVTYTLSAFSPGDLLTMAQQVSSPVTTTGRYTYTFTVTLNYATAIGLSVSGATLVDVEDSSPFGAGWTLGGVDRLVSVATQTLGTYTFAAGLMRLYGDNGVSFYTGSGGTYSSQPGDNGTLAASGGGYQYTTPDGSTWNFNSSGQETSFVSPDGQSILTYTYSGSNLAGLATPDGALTTFSYSSFQDTIQTGSRTVTLMLNSMSNSLTSISNPDGGLHSFVYDASNHLTQESFGLLGGTYAYSNRVLTGFTNGDGGPTSLSPEVLFGLSGPVLAPWPSLTDPLGRTTFEQMDRYGRPLQVLAPAAGDTVYARNSQGWVTAVTDPDNRTTTFTLDSAGYPTQISFPDGNSQGFVYQSAFHALTQFSDENLSSPSLAGRPARARDFQRQKRRKPARCQRSTVSGLTRTSARRQPAHSRDSHTQNSRSRRRSRGLGTLRRRMANCWRRARFSAARAARSTRNAPANSTRMCKQLMAVLCGPTGRPATTAPARGERLSRARPAGGRRLSVPLAPVGILVFRDGYPPTGVHRLARCPPTWRESLTFTGIGAWRQRASRGKNVARCPSRAGAAAGANLNAASPLPRTTERSLITAEDAGGAEVVEEAVGGAGSSLRPERSGQ